MLPRGGALSPATSTRGGDGAAALYDDSGGKIVSLRAQAPSNLPFPPVATFSILGYDPETGEAGGAVQSRVFSVGNGVLWAEADVGVAATQAIVDVSYGPKALALLRAGTTPSSIIKAILDSDPDPRPQDWTKAGRQFAVMDSKGNYAAYTGPQATPWAGNKGAGSARRRATSSPVKPSSMEWWMRSRKRQGTSRCV